MTRDDPLPRKSRFCLPEGLIYLDGNSLGPLPANVQGHLAEVVSAQWGELLIKAWNEAGWMKQPQRVGDLVARLIGAPSGSVMMGDTLSIKVFQAVSAAVDMRPDRRIILSDTGNFPTDLYITQGLLDTLDRNHQLRTVAPEQVIDAIDDSVAAVLLTQVDYRTGRLHDMQRISEKARLCGAVMIWDLAHSAGALPVEIEASGSEFAVGCTYKYLNGGPGAPAFIYVRPDLTHSVKPVLAGWLGHASPFAFEPSYRAAESIERLRIGTPAVLQMSALEAALTVWEGVDMQQLRQRSMDLSQRFIEEVESACPELRLASPRDPRCRGSQVSFACENGYAIMQALIARGVIGDFRAPDLMRFGFTPLYLDEQDVVKAAGVLKKIVRNRLWDRPEYRTQRAVT